MSRGVFGRLQHRSVCWGRALTAGVMATLLAAAPAGSALAGEHDASSVPPRLRMRALAPSTEAAPGGDALGDDAGDQAPRSYRGPTAIRDEPERSAQWIDPRPEPKPEPQPEPEAPTEQAGDVTPRVPPPSTVRAVPEHISVAVGLAPQAPGTRQERDLLDTLETTAASSASPTTDVRRLRAGAGEPRRVCRSRRYDLVVMIGYVADRADAVVLAHDCRLDRPLSMLSSTAVVEPALISTLWNEHIDLQRSGLRERRRLSLSPAARGGIIAGVATIVVGIAVGALVANALRKESVVITVRP